MWTSSGRILDLRRIAPADIDAEDVIRSLSRQSRFLGHSSVAWSVAQHSLFVARLAVGVLGANPLEYRYALLHDAHEAYLGDITRPVATLLGVNERLDELRAELDRAIHRRFGLFLAGDELAETLSLVKRADDLALVCELMSFFPAIADERKAALPLVAQWASKARQITLPQISDADFARELRALSKVSTPAATATSSG